MKMQRWRHKLLGWQYLGLFILVLITLILHFAIITQPGQVAFDEYYYVGDARNILQGQGEMRFEHPPLGELYVVLGMFLFGDSPFGWRFFSVIFGAISIVLFYLICRKLDMPKEASFFATFLLALENLSFVQASIAMLDVYSFTFMLVSFLLYLNSRYLLSGVSVGLSALAKLFGALAFPAIFLDWLFSGRRRLRQFLWLTLLAPVSFVLLISPLDLAVWGKAYMPFERIKLLLSQSGVVTFENYTHPAASRPWDWVLKPEIMFYWYEPQYIGAISFTIGALIIPAAIYMVFLARRGDKAAIFGLSWFAGTYLIWIPLTFITDRLSYVYYFYPAVGSICIGIALGLSHLLKFARSRESVRTRRALKGAVATYLALHVGAFVILSPVFARWITVIPIPTS